MKRTVSLPIALLAGSVIVILACFWFWTSGSSEPIYKGKSLSTWTRQLNEGDVAEREAAVAAIRAMEKQAVPALITSLAPRNGRIRNILIALPRRIGSPPDKYITIEAERGYAATGLGIIGPSAAAAIPALIAASKETNAFCAARAKAALIQIRQDPVDSLVLPPVDTRNLTNWLQSAEILLALGSNIQTSADAMVAAIGKNNFQRFQIVESLGFNTREPSASVLLLRGLLKDNNEGIRMNVLNMLVTQRAFAKTARNEIQQCLNDRDPNVILNAKFALAVYFPEQGDSGIPTEDSNSTKNPRR